MFSSSWTPPKHKSSYHYENIDGIQNISYIPKLPRDGNLNHHIIKQAIDFHGLSLSKRLFGSLINESLRSLPIYEELNLDYEGYEDDEGVNTEVLDFICEKAPWIFKTNGDKKVVGLYRLFQWKCYATLDRYNCLPPLEYFLQVGPDVCEQEFYKSVCTGDILFGKVIDHVGDSHILQIIATGGYHHRNLLGTNIKAELKWCDLSLDKQNHLDQKLVLSDDTGIERKMWKINTVLTVEVLHTPNITDGKIVTEETILVGTKGLVLEKLYYQYLEEKQFHVNKFPLGHCDIENCSNVFPSILKSIESKEVNSYDECLMKLKLNVNSKYKSIKTMCRCLDVNDKFCLSLMNSIHNASHSRNEITKIRQVQGKAWIKEVHERKSLLEKKKYANTIKETLKDVARYPNSANIIMSHIIFNKNRSRYKDALHDLKYLTIHDKEARKSTIVEVILEYAKERESTQNLIESMKLYKKCIEIDPDNEEANLAIERLKELDPEEGKDKDVEELEKLLELKEDLKKVGEKMSLLSETTSIKELLQSGLLKLIDEEIQKYHCNICNLYIFGMNIETHIYSKKHTTCFKQLITTPSENLESLQEDIQEGINTEHLETLREDIEEGINTGLIKVIKRKRKGKPNYYECTACLKTMNSIDILTVHMDTKRHEETVNRGPKKIVTFTEAEEKQLNEAMEMGIIKCDSTGYRYHCVPCESLVGNKNNTVNHILGRKHQANVMKLKVTDAMSSELQKLYDEGTLTKVTPGFGSTDHIACTVCDITTPSISHMVSHLKGHNHKSKSKEKEKKKKRGKRGGKNKNVPKQENNILPKQENNQPPMPEKDQPPKQEKITSLKNAYTHGCVIYVSNISSVATEADVINSISMFGRIKTARVRLSNHEALIEMCEEEDARDIVADQEIIKIHEQAIDIQFSKQHKDKKLEGLPATRVLLFYNLPNNETITNNRSLIEMASPYGEVTGVVILGTNEREGGRRALLEMVDIASATNLMRNFPFDQKESQNILVKYSNKEILTSCYRPASKRKSTGTSKRRLTGVSQGTYTGGNTEPLAHEIASDYQLTTQKRDLPPKKMSDKKLLQPDYLMNAHEITSGHHLTSQNELQRTNQPASKRKLTRASQGTFTGGNTEPLAHEILSDQQFTSQNELQRSYRPAPTGKFTRSSQGNYTGGNTEPLAHEIVSDYMLPTQKRDLLPKKMSHKKLLQPDYLINAVKDKLPTNISDKKLLQPDYLINAIKGLPPKNIMDKKLLQPDYLINEKKDLPPKKVYDYGHKNVPVHDGPGLLEALPGLIHDSFVPGYNDKNVTNTHRVPFQSNAPFSNPTPQVSIVRSPAISYNAPSSQVPSQFNVPMTCPPTVPTLPSPSVDYNTPTFLNENIARNESNTSEYYKSASKSAQAILSGPSKKRMSEHIQPKNTSETLSTKIGESLGLRSGAAEELENIMLSMDAEQRNIWKERLSKQVKSIEQEIEEAFDKSMGSDGHFNSDSEFEDSRKRKQFEGDQEERNLVGFASKKSKFLLEDENPPDKSKFHVYARGLSIDRTQQEVHDFFSNYGVITDVHLEWCNNPTFVGEQSAYIAFKEADDVTVLLNQHQNFYIKDSLISLQMYIDSSESNISVILVTGINYIYSDTKNELTNYFNMFGSVKAVLLNTTNSNSHYAFVVFYSKESAKEIILRKEPYVFYKNTLKLTEAKSLKKELDKSEITQKIMTVPADKFGPHINQSVKILKDIMNETGATYEFERYQTSSHSQALMIHGTPEQIFSAKKIINQKSGMQKSNKLTEQNAENDPPNILIITDHVYEVLEDVCLSEVDLELNTSVKILQNITLPRLFNEVSMILNEMTNVKYVIFIFGIQDLTENINTSKGFINVPKNNFIEFLEQSQTVSDRLHKHFPGLKFFWTTPTPYNFKMYNRKMMSRNKNDSSQLLPTEYWRKMQGNFHKCLIHLRKMMLESDPHYTVDFLKLFLYSENSSEVLSGEQMLLEGKVPKENWFSKGYMKLNLQGGKALRYCIHKTVYRQVLWGSDSEGRMEWIHYVRAMLDSEQQERDHCHRDLQPQPLPIIEEVIRQQQL